MGTVSWKNPGNIYYMIIHINYLMRTWEPAPRADKSAPTGVWVHLLISIIFRFSNWYCWWNSKQRYSKDTPLVFVTIASVASLVTGIIANLLSFIIQALRLSTHLIVMVREIVFVDSICNVCISCITCNRYPWLILREIIPPRVQHRACTYEDSKGSHEQY